MAGDDEPECYEDFFGRMLPRVIRSVRRLTGDPWLAEDVAVEALARAHLHWGRVAKLPWREAWVLKVASREALRQVREQWWAMAPADVGDSPDDVTQRIALVAALVRLPRHQRETVVLHYVCDLPETDVAHALKVPESVVKAQLHRGIGSLSSDIGAALKKEYIDGNRP